MLSEHNYPTIQAQERLNQVLMENNNHKVEVKNVKPKKDGLIEFEANIGGIFEKHILTEDNTIWMYYNYYWHNGVSNAI